ncbi:hypothetical protein GY45DRAFT_1367644 [Cubamyces sp. BRFM 1775]|nr:hypothetical protein GY45DRAFT_1367644 [Cubamyces sp. BRFM 1775]
MSQQHWTMELNNFCAKNRMTCSWVEGQCGPRNAPTWTVSAFINGIEYGRGSSLTKTAAKEIAAETALRSLWQQRGF